MLRDVFRGREVEAEVGEHHEILHQGIAEGDQSVAFNAQHPKQEGKGEQWQQVVHSLEQDQGDEVAGHRVLEFAFYIHRLCLQVY